MTEFEQLKAWLDAWYEHGDERAARRFVETFLQPFARRVARSVMSATDADDCVQGVALTLLDRTRRLGERAQSVGYWMWKIRKEIKSFLRSRSTLSAREVPTEDDEPERPPVDEEAFEDRMVAALTRRRFDGHAWLKARLAAMPVGRRVFFLVHYHRELLPFFEAADFSEIERRSGWPRTQVEAFFGTDAGDDPNALLPLLFAAAEIAADRSKCLDTFRKGRKRAYEDLKTAFDEGEDL